MASNKQQTQQKLEKAGATKLESNQYFESWVLGKKTIYIIPGQSNVFVVDYPHKKFTPSTHGQHMTIKAALA